MKKDSEPKASVLIVDDEAAICAGCEKILSRAGFETVSVFSGKEALGKLRERRFDIVLTDLKMAEMGGLELLENLQLHHPDCVPVVMTGYASVASVVETMKLGAHDYLPKPFTPQELVAVIEKAWEKSRRVQRRRAASGRAISTPPLLGGRSWRRRLSSTSSPASTPSGRARWGWR